MILIKSINRDVSTDQVVRWLIKYNVDFKRLNDLTKIKIIEYVNNSFVVVLSDGVKINFNDIQAYWYRRGNYHYNWNVIKSNCVEFDETYLEFVQAENKALGEFFVKCLKENVPSIGDSDSCTNVNKNVILMTASKCGLNIPDFIITTNRNDVATFMKKHQYIITKPIHSSFIYGTDDYWLPTYTEIVDSEILKKSPAKFQPTLFQKYIDKKIEIRTFYLEEKFYSMAIFSQNDTQTKTDFRVYNDERPNRTVPFQLPHHIEVKLKKLMDLLKFESGSMDLIYSTDHNFYFLEVNPIGQFGMVSFPCNYYLEKEIAVSLAKK